MPNKLTIPVTGGTGQVGLALNKELGHRNGPVRALVRHVPRRYEDFAQATAPAWEKK